MGFSSTGLPVALNICNVAMPPTKRFGMAVIVGARLAHFPGQTAPDSSRFLGYQKFLNQNCGICNECCILLVRKQIRVFVLKSRYTGWFQPHNLHSLPCVRGKRGNVSQRILFRPRQHSLRDQRARSKPGLEQARLQILLRSARQPPLRPISGLLNFRKCIQKQHTCLPVEAPVGGLNILLKRRVASSGSMRWGAMSTVWPSIQRNSLVPRHKVGERRKGLQQPEEHRDLAKQPAANRKPVDGLILTQEFRLQSRHIHLSRTFRFAAFTLDAKV